MDFKFCQTYFKTNWKISQLTRHVSGVIQKGHGWIVGVNVITLLDCHIVILMFNCLMLTVCRANFAWCYFGPLTPPNYMYFAPLKICPKGLMCYNSKTLKRKISPV